MKSFNCTLQNLNQQSSKQLTSGSSNADKQVIPYQIPTTLYLSNQKLVIISLN